MLPSEWVALVDQRRVLPETWTSRLPPRDEAGVESLESAPDAVGGGEGGDGAGRADREAGAHPAPLHGRAALGLTPGKGAARARAHPGREVASSAG